MNEINAINLFTAVQTAQKTANYTGIAQTIKLKDYTEKTEKENTVKTDKTTATKE